MLNNPRYVLTLHMNATGGWECCVINQDDMSARVHRSYSPHEALKRASVCIGDDLQAAGTGVTTWWDDRS